MNTSIETCPSLEDLAAFLDGRLSGYERNRVVTHLADCPRCYEVFAEAARFQLSEEKKGDKDPPGEGDVAKKVFPFPRKPISPWISSIAAVLAVSLLGLSLYWHYTIPQISSAQLASQAVSRKAPEDRFWADLVKRGGPPPTGGGFTIPHEILLGAHAFDLHLSLGRNDSELALNDLVGINTHIEEIGFLPDQAKAYKEIQKQIYEGQPASRFIQKANELEASLSGEDDPYLDFGKWLEAGRLAAFAENPDFFQAPKNQKFLQNFLRHEVRNDNLDSEVATALRDIQDTLNRTDASSLPYEDLQARFKKILTFYQKQSEQGLGPVGLSPAP